MSAKPPLYLRGNVWWCYVRNPAGGRRLEKSTGCRDYQAGVIRWRELERDSVRAPDRPQDETPLRVALETRHDERAAAGRSAGTLSMLEVKGNQLCRVLGKDTPLARIDAEAIDGYVSTRLKEGAQRTTVAKELSTLRGALKLAKRHGKYHKDLAEVMPEFSPKYRPKERALSEKEIKALLGKLEPKRRAVVAFLLATGATYPSEVVNLVKGDVDKKRWMVRIRGTKRETRARVVPVVSFARPWLELALPYIPFERWTNVRRDLHKACDEARIARCSPNDLRRSVATLMRARGVEPSLLGAFLGHGDSRMAERVYGRLAPEQLAHLLDQRMRSSSTRRQRTA